MNLRISNSIRGFTLIETVMAMASVGAVGLAIFYTLFTGLLLFTKNTAMNVSHEEARVALIQLQQDLHSAVSLPELTDSNANMISGQGPSPGVEFQVLLQASQYCQVTANASTGQSIVKVGIPSGYPTPYSGTRLIIPAYQIEENVTAVSVSGTVATCTLDVNIPTAINVSDSYGNYNVVCFFTQRVYYYVTGSASQGANAGALVLNYIGVNKTASYIMAATDISTTDQNPFSIPSTTSGAPNYRYVVAVNLSAEDPNTSALATRFKFNTSSIMLSGQIPAYSTLTSYQ